MKSVKITSYIDIKVYLSINTVVFFKKVHNENASRREFLFYRVKGGLF